MYNNKKEERMKNKFKRGMVKRLRPLTKDELRDLAEAGSIEDWTKPKTPFNERVCTAIMVVGVLLMAFGLFEAITRNWG